MNATLQPIPRGIAPTAVFTALDTIYGTVYRPVNELARNCTRFAGVSELTSEQRIILEEHIGFNFEVRR